MALSKLAAQEQSSPGGLNPEFTFSNAFGKFRWEACTKNPGHQPFIPVNDFKKEHLPLRYQKDLVVDSIKSISDLTVRVVTNYTSLDRPITDSSYAMRGKKFGRLGSGFVHHVIRRNPKEPCPCKECQASSERRAFAASVFVKTANHVVFDDSEAEKTVAELFFDDELNQDGVKKLIGFQVVGRDAIDDWCEFECIIHDENLADKLSETLKQLKERIKQLETEVFDPDRKAYLAVVASHPHGRSKQISLGELKRLDRSTMTKKDKPVRISEGFCETACTGDSVIFTYNFKHPSGFGPHGMVTGALGAPEEAEPESIGITVRYPDKTKQECNIWQLGQKVIETKKWLLNTGGIQEPSENYKMVILVPVQSHPNDSADEEIEMDDSKYINNYIDYLTVCNEVFFKKCSQS